MLSTDAIHYQSIGVSELTRRGIHVAITIAAILFAYSDLVGGDRVPIYRDLLPFVYPYRLFLAEAFARGEWPLWNPYIHLGVPFLASLHASALYPPSLLLLIPFPLGFNVFLMAHYVIAAAGIAALLRERGLRVEAIAVGVIVFTVGGYMASSLTNTAHLQAAVWLPWILLCWELHRRRGGALAAILTALLLAMQVCAGAPEVWMLTVALLAGRALFGTHTPRRLACVVRLGFVVVAAVALVTIQLLPLFEYLGESRRSGVLDAAEATAWSLERVSLLQFLFPHSSALVGSHEAGTVGTYLETGPPLVYSLYVGIFGLVFAIVGAIAGRERFFWGTVAAATILFAMGPGSPVFDLAKWLLPMVVGRIRYPEKVLVMLHLPLAVLAAEGAAATLEKRSGTVRLSSVVAATFVFITGGVLVVGYLDPSRLASLAAILTGRGELPLGAFRLLVIDLVYKAERSSVLLGAWLALLLLESRGGLRPKLLAPILVLILAVDVASVHRNLALSVGADELRSAPIIVDVEELRREHGRLFHYQRRLGTAKFPGLIPYRPEIFTRTDLRQFAIDQWQSLFLDLGMIHGVGTLSGFDSIGEPMSVWNAVASLPLDGAIRLLGAYGVHTLVGVEVIESPEVEALPLAPGESLRAYRVRHPLPFAFLASELEVADEERAFDLLADPAFPRDRRATVTHVPDGWRDSPAPSEEEIVIERPGAGEIRIHVSTRNDRFLVVNERHFPGWTATVGGKPTEIHTANGLARGVVVPAGDHTIRFRYEPMSFRIGAAVSAFVAVAVLISIGWRCRATWVNLR